jgi:amidophosphoribosyltransferase
LKESCGIFGIYSFSGEQVAPYVYKGLIALQHRGQDSAGMAVFDGKKVRSHKGIGQVDDVFRKGSLEKMPGAIGIGHVRYPTVGECTVADAQPMCLKAGEGIALAHNGNVANFGSLRRSLEERKWKFDSTCDAEGILKEFASAYREKKDIFEAAKACMETIDGAYSVVMIVDGKLVAMRDPYAIKPICYSQTKECFAVASESVAFDIDRLPLSGFLEPGEVMVVSEAGRVERRVLKRVRQAHCMFEYVYFARPDSNLDGKLVYEARVELGRRLAKTAPVQADIVIPVPDTARPAALGYSQASGIELVEGLIKNRYVGRTFIMGSQSKREDAVRLKLNAVVPLVEGKKVVLVDDSIVRGTTSGPIVKLLRDAGAKEIHVRITCPPIVGPCFYGIDLPTYKELVAVEHSVDEICKLIGADSLAYQKIEELVAAIGMPKEELCLGCLTEKYPTPLGKKLCVQLKKEDGGKGRVWETA